MKNLFVVGLEHEKFLTDEETSQCFEHTDLDWREKGVLLFLLTRPNDFNFVIRDLTDRSKKTSEHVARKTLKQLVDKKYLFRILKRKNGAISSWGYLASSKKMSNLEAKKAVLRNCEGWTLY